MTKIQLGVFIAFCFIAACHITETPKPVVFPTSLPDEKTKKESSKSVASQKTIGSQKLKTIGGGTALYQVTKDANDDFRPVLSPDSRRLLFEVRSKEKKFSIVGVQPTEESERTVYTPKTSNNRHPAWIADSKSFLLATDRTGSFQIVRSLSMSPGAGVALLSMSSDAGDQYFSPSVSPDGKRLAFGIHMKGRFNVAVSDINGKNLILIGPGKTPRWSPGGDRIVFSREIGGNRHIFTASASTGAELVQVTGGEHVNEFPCFSPDGKTILFASNRVESGWQLFVADLDGSNVKQLTEGSSSNTQPFWAADGHIYFASNAAGNFDIWRFHTDMSDSTLSAKITSNGKFKPLIVAAFPIQFKKIVLSKTEFEAMNDLLASRLVETGIFQIVPRDQLRKRLVDKKKESYKKCFSKTCQIEMGKEVAAQKSLSTQIVRLGSKCTVNMVLYDLLLATASEASVIRGGCGVDAITSSLEKAASDLAHKVKSRS